MYRRAPSCGVTIRPNRQFGDDANEYKLTTAKGGTWKLKSEVTGVVSHAKMHGMKEGTKSEAKEHGVDEESTEHGHMTVTNLEMVSESCRQ